MELDTAKYVEKKGWSVDPLPAVDSDKTLILVFASPELIKNPSPIRELSQKYPQSKIIGCSSAGEIFGPTISDNSLSVAFVRFEKTPFQTVKTKINSAEDSFAAGGIIAKQLARPNLRAIMVFSDGLKVNGSELVKGLNESVDQGVVITGGLAGDGSQFQSTSTIYNDEILSDHIVAVGLYDDHVRVGHASRGGWDNFGPERLITRSRNNVLYELDNKPALKLYKEYLGERASGLPATGLLFPLAIRKDDTDDKHLVRTILGVDEKTQSLTFAGDVPANYRAQLMKANFDRLISSAGEAGETAFKRMAQGTASQSAKPMLSLAISCVGRRLLLGERTEEEIESVLSSLPSQTQQVGFYSYGELSPYGVGKCDLHNQTMTLTTIDEI